MARQVFRKLNIPLRPTRTGIVDQSDQCVYVYIIFLLRIKL